MGIVSCRAAVERVHMVFCMEHFAPCTTSAYCWMQAVLTLSYSDIEAGKLSELQKQQKRPSALLFFQMCWSEFHSFQSDKHWDFKKKSENVVSSVPIFSHWDTWSWDSLHFCFFLVGLAKPNQTCTLLEEVTITYFHSTLVFCNPKTKFLSWTYLQYSCIFEQFALENLYNGCLPMDHEKHQVTLSVKHKRNIYRSDNTFQKDLLI